MKKEKEENGQNQRVAGANIALIFLVTIIVLVAILLVSFFGMHLMTSNRKIVELKADWTLSDGVVQKRVTLPSSVSVTHVGKMELSHKLGIVTTGDVLLISAEHENIMVKLEGEVIYSFESTGVLNDYCGKAYLFVPLSYDMSEKQITLVYDFGNDVSKMHIAMPIIGSHEAITSYLFRQHFAVLILGGFILVGGIFMATYALVLAVKKQKKSASAKAKIGFFLFTVAAWHLIDTGLVQFLGERESFLYLLNYSCQMIFIVPLLWYYAEHLDYRYSILEFMCELAMLATVVSVVIFVRGAADLYRLIICSQLIVIISAVALLYTLIIERAKDGKMHYTMSILGSFLLVVAGMLKLLSGMSVGGGVVTNASSIIYLLTAATFFVAYERK